MAESCSELAPLFDDIVSQLCLLREVFEREFVQLMRLTEDFQRRWSQCEHRESRRREALDKAAAERAALEVKLRRNETLLVQEGKRRRRAELESEKLDLQMRLVRDVLEGDQGESLVSRAELCRALSKADGRRGEAPWLGKTTRSTTIEEPSVKTRLHSVSDRVSDRTDSDSETTSTSALCEQEAKSTWPPVPAKRSSIDLLGRRLVASVDKGESILATTKISVSPDGGHVETLSTLSPGPRRCSRHGGSPSVTSEPHVDQDAPRAEGVRFGEPRVHVALCQHTFRPKTNIRRDTCVSCERNIKFGKVMLKCRHCNMVSHPECRDLCPLPCHAS